MEQGRLLETPTFEWLDAHETKTTCFWLSMWSTPAVGEECSVVTLKKKRCVSCEKEGDVLTERKEQVKERLVLEDEQGLGINVCLF